MTLQRKKEIGISVFLVLYSVLFFFGFSVMVNQEAVFTTFGTVVTAVFGLFWIASMSAGLAFITDRAGTNYILAFIFALIVVLAGLTAASIVGGVLLLVILFAAQQRLHTEKESRIKSDVIPLFFGATKLIAWGGLLALLSLAYTQVAQDFSSQQIAIPEKYVAAVMKPAEPLIEGYFPGYKAGGTIDDIVDAQLESQRASLPPGASFPPDAHQMVLRDFSKTFGQNLTGRETMATVVTNIINNFIRSTSDGSSLVFALGLFLVTLLAVRALIPFLVWPAILLIKGIIAISIQVGLVSVLKTQITVDRMTL